MFGNTAVRSVCLKSAGPGGSSRWPTSSASDSTCWMASRTRGQAPAPDTPRCLPVCRRVFARRWQCNKQVVGEVASHSSREGILPGHRLTGIAAVDPGVRTMNTWFSAQGQAGEIGRQNPDGHYLANMFLPVDNLRGRMTKRTAADVPLSRKRKPQAKVSPAQRKRNKGPMEAAPVPLPEPPDPEHAPEVEQKQPLVETHARRWRLRRALWRIESGTRRRT